MKRFLLVVLVACTPAPATTPVAAVPHGASVAIGCGPALAGIEKLAGAPLVIVGELHGQAGPPAFAADLACRCRATLALEIPKEEQPGIDAFLASDGGAEAKKALLVGTHWTRPFQDGRSSTAMLGLLEQARTQKLRIVAVDDDQERGQTDREQAMARRLVKLVNERSGPVVMLVGNYHAHTAVGAPWDPKLEFMGSIVKKDVPKLVSLDERYGPGDSWVCFSPDANECGRTFSRGNGSGPPGSIEIFPQPDEAGFSGTYSVGDAVVVVDHRVALQDDEVPRSRASAATSDEVGGDQVERGIRRRRGAIVGGRSKIIPRPRTPSFVFSTPRARAGDPRPREGGSCRRRSSRPLTCASADQRA